MCKPVEYGLTNRVPNYRAEQNLKMAATVFIYAVRRAYSLRGAAPLVSTHVCDVVTRHYVIKFNFLPTWSCVEPQHRVVKKYFYMYNLNIYVILAIVKLVSHSNFLVLRLNETAKNGYRMHFIGCTLCTLTEPLSSISHSFEASIIYYLHYFLLQITNNWPLNDRNNNIDVLIIWSHTTNSWLILVSFYLILNWKRIHGPETMAQLRALIFICKYSMHIIMAYIDW